MSEGLERRIEGEKEAARRAREVEEAERRLVDAPEADQAEAESATRESAEARALREEADCLALSEADRAGKAEARLLEEGVSETGEQQRVEAAAEAIRKIDRLTPEQWRRLDRHGRRAALDRAGRELSEAYDHPRPPLIIPEDEDARLQGEYSDSEYWIFLNRAAETDREQRLLGEDPVCALRAYAHEWRHSYQYEQATLCEGPFMHLADDPDQAARWWWEIKVEKDYKDPPDDELAESDPEEYRRQFEAYWEQPVERDARRFADQLVEQVYGRSPERRR